MTCKKALAVVLIVAMCGCSPAPLPEAAPASVSVTVMSFNVQNLFDNVDDPGKDSMTRTSRSATRSRSIAGETNACTLTGTTRSSSKNSVYWLRRSGKSMTGLVRTLSRSRKSKTHRF